MGILTTNRNFQFLFSASAISNLGDGISALAFPWLATLISRDPFAVALVAMATRLPWLLFSLPVGVLTDRADWQRLMVQADILRMGLTFGVIALILGGPALPIEGQNTGPMIWALAGAAFLLDSAEVVRDNAAQTMLPSIVDRQQLESANGQMWSIEQIMGAFVGPPLAGFLIAYAVPLPFAFDAVSFGLAAWLVWCIALTRPTAAKPKQAAFLTELGEGLHWIWQHKIILQLAIMLGLMNALATMTLTIFILFSQEILGLSAVGHGILMTAGAAGGVLGGLLCPNIAARLGARKSLLVALSLFPIPFAILHLTSNTTVAGAALFVEMFAALLWNVVTVSYRQRAIPDAQLGRVNSIYRFFGWGMMPLGALAAGLVVSWAEPELGREAALRLPFALAAIASTAIFAYGAWQLKLPKNGVEN